MKFHAIRPPVLIVGFPRSGTGYVARLMRMNGFDVGHEQWRKHGMSSWFATAKEPGPYGDPVEAEPAQTYILTRHPLDVIQSARTLRPDSISFIERMTCEACLDDEGFVRAYVAWYKMAEKNFPGAVSIRAEDCATHFGFRDNLAHNINTRPYKRKPHHVIWKALSENAKMALSVFAVRYGYSMPGE